VSGLFVGPALLHGESTRVIRQDCLTGKPEPLLLSREDDVTIGSLRDPLWYLAIILGWLAIISLAGAWYAGRRFHALLKAPLTEEVEHLTHAWERRVIRWRAAGLALSGLSLLCLVFWQFVGMIP